MNVVFELREDDYEGQRYGLFATRALVEAEIVRLALDGGTPKLAIYELNVQGEPVAPEQLGLVPANWDDQTVADALSATALPWRFDARENYIVDADEVFVLPAFTLSMTTTEQDNALAELVVRMVNQWAARAGLTK